MTGTVHNKSCDTHAIECSTPTKIKVLGRFNDMGKYCIILSEKRQIQNSMCIFSIVMPTRHICMEKCWKEIHRNVHCGYF